MITCPVCRFDAPLKAELCPDCGTRLDGSDDPISSNDSQEDNGEKPKAQIGDLILEEYTLQKLLNDDPDAPQFQATNTQDQACLVTIIYEGSSTRPLVLAKVRDPILKLAHPHIEEYLKVATDPHERCIIVTKDTPLLKLADIIKAGHFTENDPLPLNKLPQFFLDVGRLLELFHRKHCLPGLPIDQWRVRDSSPLVQGLMKSRLDALDIPEKDQANHKQQELNAFRSLCLDLEKQLQKQQVTLPEPLTQLFIRLQDIPNPESLTASKLLSALALPQTQAKKSPVLRKRNNKGFNPKNHKPHAHQHIHIDRSDMPSIASGAPNITTPREVVKGRHFVPRSLRKERYVTARNEQDKIAKLTGKARECHEIQLRDDLRLINFTGWLLPFFAASNPITLALSIPLAAIAIPLVSSLTSKKANAPGAFFGFLMIGVTLALLLGTGGPGVLWAAFLATVSAVRANRANELARQNPWSQQEEIYGESLIDAKTRELSEFLKSARLMITGSAALTLSLLPAASVTEFIHASASQGMIFGALATYFGLQKLKRGQGRPRNVMAAALFIAGLLCCWSYILTPLALLSGLIMTAVMAFGFGTFVEQCLAEDKEATRLQENQQGQGHYQQQSNPLPIQVQNRSSTRRHPPMDALPRDFSEPSKSSSLKSQKPQQEVL